MSDEGAALIRGRVAPVLVGSDLARLAAAVSVGVALAVFGWVGGALFFLVLGGTLLPRALAAPAPLDATYCWVILFAGWAAQLDLYLAFPWLDVLVHAAATGLVAVVVHLALVRVGAAPAGYDARLARPRLAGAVLTTCLGLALAVIWEILEWFGHTRIDQLIQVGYADTMGDLAAGGVGALVAGLILARSAPPARARE